MSSRIIETVVLEKTHESPLDCKQIKAVNPKGTQPSILTGRTDVEVEAPILWPPNGKNQLTRKYPKYTYSSCSSISKQNRTQPNKNWAKDLNRHFSKENIQMVKKYMKRCSASLSIREMQIKAIMMYGLTQVRMAIIQKSTNNTAWRGCGIK